MVHHCRFKGNSVDPKDQVALAIPDALVARCTGLFSTRGCSINMENGDLTLDTVVVDDEGPYVCRKLFQDNSSYSSDYRMRQLNVNGELWSSKNDPQLLDNRK